MTKFTQMAANEDDGSSRRRIHLREISGDSDLPLETVGQDLRAARIRRGDDLAAVSRALKIRKDHLDALESDRLDDLPGKTYAIGFVRSYARYLGLDAVETAERFKAEISGRSEEHQPEVTNIHQDDSRRLPYGWRVVAGLVIVALLYGAWHLFFAARDPVQPVPPPPVPDKVVAQSEKPAPSATVTMPEPPATTPAPAAAPAAPQAVATPPASTPTPPAAKPPVQPDAQAAVPAVAPAAASNQVFGAQNENARVVLRARSDARVTVRGADGKLYLNRDLKAGETYRVPDLPGLALATNNGGALEVDLDGIDMGRVGQQQQVLGRVSLDPQSLVDRFNIH